MSIFNKEKIENTKSIYVWLLFLIIYISFSTEVLFRPFVFAEDTLFLNDALVYGYKSLLFRHAGYLEIFSRIIGNISIVAGGVFNNYLVSTFCMKIVAIFVVTYYVIYFGIEDFAWLVKEKFLRYIICFIILVCFGNFFNCFYNITYIHWIGEFFIFLVGLNLVFNKKLPGIFCSIVCVMTCLQSPEGCLLIVPLAIYVFFRIRERTIKASELVFYLFVFLSTVFQYYALKTSSYSTCLGLESILSAFYKSIISVLSCPSYVLGNEIMSYLSNMTRFVLGVLLWIFIIFSYININRKHGLFLILYVVGFLFSHYIMIHVKPVTAGYVNQDYWCYSSPALIITLVFLGAIVNINSFLDNQIVKRAIFIFLTIFLLSQVSHVGKIDGLGGQHYKTYDYDMLGMNRIEEANKSVDFRGKNYERVTLYAGWVLLIPIR